MPERPPRSRFRDPPVWWLAMGVSLVIASMVTLTSVAVALVYQLVTGGGCG